MNNFRRTLFYDENNTFYAEKDIRARKITNHHCKIEQHSLGNISRNITAREFYIRIFASLQLLQRVSYIVSFYASATRVKERERERERTYAFFEKPRNAVARDARETSLTNPSNALDDTSA